MANDIRVTGLAAVFNSRSEDLGGFVEVIAPGAFRESLASGDNIYLLHSHDVSRPLASTRSGSLGLREDGEGLRFDARLIDSGVGGEVGRLVRRGDVQSMSFGFMVENAADESFSRVNGQMVRTIRRAKLLEISTVSFPAYPAASIQARSLADDIDERQRALTEAQQAERQRDLRRRKLKTAQAEIQARQTPPPEPLHVIQERARRKRVQFAKRFNTTV